MSGWISVEVCLPADGVCVIGSGWLYGDESKGRWVEPTVYSKEDCDFHPITSSEYGELEADFDGTMHPTHWIPLPSAPL